MLNSLRSGIYGLLRKSEGFFKTDMVYLTKGGFWLSLGHVVSIFIGFVSSIAFANFFTKEAFGNYKFILSLAGLIGAFSLSGMGTAIVQAVAQGRKNILRQGFRINLKWNVGIFLAGLGLSTYYFLNGNLTLSFSFLIAGILLPISLSANLYSAYLLGKKDYKRNSFYGIIHNALPSLSIILAVVLTRNLLVVVIGYFLSTALVTLFLYRKTVKAYKEEESSNEGELLSYSGHLSLMDVIGKIVSFLDKILIFHYLGAAPLAIYSFAIAPVEQLQSGKKILSILVMPKAAQRSFEELQQSTPRKAPILIVYALTLAGLWILVAPYFYKLLFPQYLDSVIYSQIYSLTLLAVTATLFQETLVAHKKTRELYFLRTSVPIIQLVLYAIMLPLYGIMGLIITHVIMRSLSALISFYLVKRPFEVKAA